MIVFYFADPLGDIKEEAISLLKRMLRDKINIVEVREFDTPECFDKKFDVLFFDWGGMSIGNSLLESFCDEILKHAVEHPSRIYIMNSTFTKQAMKEMLIGHPEASNINNVFLDYNSALPYLKTF